MVAIVAVAGLGFVSVDSAAAVAEQHCTCIATRVRSTAIEAISMKAIHMGSTLIMPASEGFRK